MSHSEKPATSPAGRILGSVSRQQPLGASSRFFLSTTIEQPDASALRLINKLVIRVSRQTLIWTLMLGLGSAHHACGAQTQEDNPSRDSAGNLSRLQSKDVASNDIPNATDEEPDPAAYTDRAAQRFYERVFRRLKRMKLLKEKNSKSDESDKRNDAETMTPADLTSTSDPKIEKNESSISDSFVIGTAAVHPSTQHADVCFRAVSGIDSTAREITRFQGETFARGEISYWHVFYRVSAEDNSQNLLAQLQQKYDETVAYRSQLMRQYDARTIRRC